MTLSDTIRLIETVIGEGKGDDKALEAVKMAVESPLLETTITGASHVIVNVSGDITLADASDAASYVQNLAGEEVNIIFGAMYDATKSDSCSITVIATGLEDVSGSSAVMGKPSAGMSFKPNAPIAPSMPKSVNVFPNTNTVPKAPIQPLQGIQKPVDIRSSVEEKSLKIPDFLQRK